VYVHLSFAPSSPPCPTRRLWFNHAKNYSLKLPSSNTSRNFVHPCRNITTSKHRETFFVHFCQGTTARTAPVGVTVVTATVGSSQTRVTGHLTAVEIRRRLYTLRPVISNFNYHTWTILHSGIRVRSDIYTGHICTDNADGYLITCTVRLVLQLSCLTVRVCRPATSHAALCAVLWSCSWHLVLSYVRLPLYL